MLWISDIVDGEIRGGGTGAEPDGYEVRVQGQSVWRGTSEIEKGIVLGAILMRGQKDAVEEIP